MPTHTHTLYEVAWGNTCHVTKKMKTKLNLSNVKYFDLYFKSNLYYSSKNNCGGFYLFTHSKLIE